MSKMIETKYPTRIQSQTRVLYNKALTAVNRLAKSSELENATIYYYLDDAKTQAIKTNTLTKTIELSDKVDKKIEDDIRDILSAESGTPPQRNMLESALNFSANINRR